MDQRSPYGVSDARVRYRRKGQLTELVRRTEAGDEVILTRHGQPAVRLVPVRPTPDRETRRALLGAESSRCAKGDDRAICARSQDFLYGDDGLPQ